jgi:hypothetical protein
MVLQMTATPTTLPALDAAVEALERAGEIFDDMVKRGHIVVGVPADHGEYYVSEGAWPHIAAALPGLKALRDAVADPGEVERMLRANVITDDGTKLYPGGLQSTRDAIVEAADLIALLRAERDAALARAEAAEARVAELETDLAEHKTALAPFAALRADDGDTVYAYPRETIIRCEVSAGEIHDARAVLE